MNKEPSNRAERSDNGTESERPSREGEVDLSEKDGEARKKGQGIMWGKHHTETWPKTRTAAKPKEKTNLRSLFKKLGVGKDKTKEPKSMQLRETEDSRVEAASTVSMLQRESQELATKNAELQNLLDREKRERDDYQRKLLQDLNDAQWILSRCEASLESSIQKCSDLQEEKINLDKDVKLKERGEHNTQSKRNLGHSLEGKDREFIATKRMKEILASSAHFKKTIQQLELENTRLRKQVKGALQDEQVKVNKGRELHKALQEKVEQLEKSLQRSEGQKGVGHRCLRNLRCSLEEKDCEVITSSQKLQEALSTCVLFEQSIKELKESVQKLDCENTRLKEQETETDATLRVQDEQIRNARDLQRALQEKVEQAQNERLVLQRELEEAREKVKEQTVTDVKEHFDKMLAKLGAESQEKVQRVEEQNRELATRNAELQEHLEWETSEKENTLSYLQKELADTQLRLATCEESLEAKAHHCSDLQDEKIKMQEHINWLEGQLKEREEQNAQSKRCIHNLRLSLEGKDCEVVTSSQKLQEALSTSAYFEKTIKELKESVQKMVFENNRLKEQWKETQEIRKAREPQEVLQSLHQRTMPRQNLEEARQSLNEHTSQQQWEEVKMKFRLQWSFGMLKTEEEQSSRSQTDVEKKGDKMIENLKESVSRLDREMERNTELQKEVCRLMSLAEMKEAELFLRTQTASLQSVEWIRATSEAGLAFRLEPHIRGLESKLAQEKVEQLEKRLQRSEDQKGEGHRCLCNLRRSLEENDCEVITSSQKLKETSSTCAFEQTIKELKESAQKMDCENTRPKEQETETDVTLRVQKPGRPGPAGASAERASVAPATVGGCSGEISLQRKVSD
ncbi:hypothetical protein SKAU_G00033090 [Synaphobranchus kaupii]|uniref:CCDC144C-like coiled-coil domain-containing protein n=1 Tax=Synaphobranchus kaupii TaxID=118154 RepID=A0A9Q1GE16_SYNKA|nr:hypothetical protein SKAU_G00033090 [Synaphobranchus kaupii]